MKALSLNAHRLEVFYIKEYARAVTSYIAKCTDYVTVIKTFTARGKEKTLTDYRGALTADSTRCSLQGGRYDCSVLSQVCTLKGNQGCERHLCRENPGTPLWHRKHQTDVAGSPSSDRLPVQSGDQRWWCFSSRQAQQLLCTLWSTKPGNQRECCSFSTIYWTSPHHKQNRTSAGELADVLTDIFNISLNQAINPRCFKTSTLIPVAKKSVVSCLKDYLPVTLYIDFSSASIPSSPRN